MEEGFRTRAGRVQALFTEPGTAFVLVTSPQRGAVDQARWFADRLAATGIAVAAVVVNRVHPHFGMGSAADARGHSGPLWENLADLLTVAEAEEAQLTRLALGAGRAPAVR